MLIPNYRNDAVIRCFNKTGADHGHVFNSKGTQSRLEQHWIQLHGALLVAEENH